MKGQKIKDSLSDLLNDFNRIKTWNNGKKSLKNKIISEIDRLNLVKLVANKNKFQLSRFGQTKIIDIKEFNSELSARIESNKVELICLGVEHCDFYWIAIRKV
jgi:hypothetical protein